MDYKIEPFTKPACAAIQAPGSKSITNRALLLAAMAGQKIKIFNPLVSRDSQIMAQCLKNLGFEIEEGENFISVSGSPKKREALCRQCRHGGAVFNRIRMRNKRRRV